MIRVAICDDHQIVRAGFKQIFSSAGDDFTVVAEGATGREALDIARREICDVAGFEQPKRLAGMAYGPAIDEQWSVAARAVDYFDVKADLEAMFAPVALRFVPVAHPALHPGRSASVELDGKLIGFIGELHPKWQQKYELPQAPVLFEVDALALQQRPVPRHLDISKFPGATRDLAMVVHQSVSAQQMLDVFFNEKSTNPAGNIVQAIVLFDEYRGKGLQDDEKSLAFRFALQDTQTTLQDDAVDALMHAMAEAARTQYHAIKRA